LCENNFLSTKYHAENVNLLLSSLLIKKWQTHFMIVLTH